MYRIFRILLLAALVTPLCSLAQEWRTERFSNIDQAYMQTQIDQLDSIARIKLGRQFTGNRDSDLRLLQTLLDQKLVQREQVALLQAMGMVLGQLLRAQEGLIWTVYTDRLGRSKALQVPGINEFIFPVTQISRRAEVGLPVDVQHVFGELEQAVRDIRNKPPF